MITLVDNSNGYPAILGNFMELKTLINYLNLRKLSIPEDYTLEEVKEWLSENTSGTYIQEE